MQGFLRAAALGTALLLWGCDSGSGSTEPATAPPPDGGQSGAPPPSSSALFAACSGVRPGAPVFSGGGMCTQNFVYRDASGAEYVGTAGHCILGDSPLGGEDAGESVWPPGQGPEATDAAGNRIGRYVYAVLSPPRDFALIRLDTGVASNASVCAFGGPTGINTETSGSPSVMRYYGSGLVLGDVIPARFALVLSMSDPDELFLTSLATPGDSGGPVIDDQGRAVGVLVTVGLLLGSLDPFDLNVGTVGITRLAPQLSRANEALGRPGLSLVNGGSP